MRSKDLRDAAIFNLSSAGEGAGTFTEVRKPQPIRAAGTSYCRNCCCQQPIKGVQVKRRRDATQVGRKLFQGHSCEGYVRNTNNCSNKRQEKQEILNEKRCISEINNDKDWQLYHLFFLKEKTKKNRTLSCSEN